MKIDDIRGKLDVLSANQRQLEWLRSLSKEDFAGDARNLDSTLHRFQTSIQALIDIGAYVIASLGLPPPQHTIDVIDALRGGRVLDAPEAERYRTMVAFRNRVVHLYNRIDPVIVHDILQQHLVDLERFRRSLVEVIARHPDDPATTSPGPPPDR